MASWCKCTLLISSGMYNAVTNIHFSECRDLINTPQVRPSNGGLLMCMPLENNPNPFDLGEYRSLIKTCLPYIHMRTLATIQLQSVLRNASTEWFLNACRNHAETMQKPYTHTYGDRFRPISVNMIMQLHIG